MDTSADDGPDRTPPTADQPSTADGQGAIQSARDAAVRPGRVRLFWHTLATAWNDGIFGMSAQAAFWMTLSLPPLLLGLLGSLGFVARWFGTNTIQVVQGAILRFAGTVFNPEVVDQIIRPTVTDILTQGRSSIVSAGFVLSLWAGSSALASLVDSITTAYRQHTVRHPVWQRTFALLLYVVLLIGSVFVLPLVALGPGFLPGLLPEAVRPTAVQLVSVLYYPVLGMLLVLGLTTLYKLVLPNKLPWHRGLPGALLAMVVFLMSSSVLRLYISRVTSTGYTYGALATPIAFLLFSFFIAFAIVLGAEFNNTIQQMWPARPTRRERRRGRRLRMARYTAWSPPDPAPARPTHNAVTSDIDTYDAPSPADTTRTIGLSRNGTTEPRAAISDPPTSARER